MRSTGRFPYVRPRLTALRRRLSRWLVPLSPEADVQSGLERTTRGLDARLDAHDRAVAQLASRIAELEAVGVPTDSAGAAESIAAALASSQEQLQELAAQQSRLTERVEFIRREIMFELRYSGGARRGVDAVQAKVINPAAVAAMGDDLRLNLGCGHLPIDGFVNVDARELPGVDVVAEVTRLPFDPGSVSHLHSAHLLEHFPEEQLRREVLPYWLSLLRPGGSLTAVVPDAPTMISEHEAGRFPFEDLRLVLYGEQEYEGDFHFTMFSLDSLRSLLTEAGFSDVELVEDGRRNGVCYEMEIVARREQ